MPSALAQRSAIVLALLFGLVFAVGIGVLYAVGAYKARLTVGRPWKSGLEMTIIGTVSALVGYAVGALLKIPTVP